MKNSLDYEINQDYRCGYNAGFADGLSEAWISVAEGTPDPGQEVTIYAAVRDDGLIDTATYRGGCFMDTKWHIEQEKITHWMPKPAPPKGEALKKCVICGKTIAGFGNNPWPVKEEGECCDECNREHVIPARIDFIKTKEGDGDA